ncbi:hypothetical protein SAMN05421823_10766 [Catalinimonas alkaloidigena]|uniref:Type IX secretion system protein PorQ n=1 Tax=Catalinimonas alkaloidigena TaxID=1075417 RepID=A0A1G9LJK0_9BACT|nr:type IX secretion system protein PorQ [Catalinimonas alkaloidigena]SDL61997.1 hypothetical protein SAMN05421823_10766 [Catalinimonas alkaloidigena]
MRRRFLLFVSFLLTQQVVGQIGGRAAFDFLSLPVNARLAALGNVNVSLSDQDVNMMMANPALLQADMVQHATLNWAPYYAGINSVSLGYAFDTPNAGPVGVSFAYHNYGTLTQTDPTGAVMGEFSAADYWLGGTWAHRLENYSLGGTVKVAGSSIGSYNAFAVLADLGAAFHHPTRDFHVGLAIRNLGWIFDTYAPGATRPTLPLNVQLGLSYKPEHMPLRFSLTAHHLERPDIVYLDPSKPGTLDANGQEVKEEKKLGDQIMRHLVFGGEFVLSPNFYLRAGYNHLIRRELRLQSRSGGAGFSIGAMARIKAFEVAFARGWYHVAGGTSTLTLTSNLHSVFRKKTPAATPQ